MSPRGRRKVETGPVDAFTAMKQTLEENVKKDKRDLGMLGLESITQAMERWRWIDFCDPLQHTPNLALEWLWGARGMLAGRLMKIEAEEGVGKSSYCMLQYAMGQQTSQTWCVHEEGEGASAPPDFIASFGCNPDNILTPRLTVRSIESCFNNIDWITYNMRKKADKADDKVIDPDMQHAILVGVDSVSSFGSSANMEDDDAGSGGLGFHSRFLSEWFRDRWALHEDRQVLLMVIAQLREKIDTGPKFPGMAPSQGPKLTTLASRPLNYHASYRLEMRASPMKEKEPPYNAYGEYVTLKVTKNKLSPKGKLLEVPLVWNAGFNFVEATIDLLKKLSPIPLKDGRVFSVEARGAWIAAEAILGSEKVQSNQEGKAHLLDVFYKNLDLLMLVREALRIRGFGFDFEKKYIPTPLELEDINQTEDDAVEAAPFTGPAPVATP